MPLPTFLIIGAGRSGTTSLHHYLAQHPEVFMCPVKEPNYFCGPELPAPGAPGAGWTRQTSTATREEYESLFAGVSAQKAIGEVSPRYLRARGAAERIRAAIPEARLIAILRHPVERAHAAYLGSRRDGFEPAPTFAAALRSCISGERDAWPFMQYVLTSRYFDNLEAYRRNFPPEQLRVYLFEDLQRDPHSLLVDLFAFIGVEPGFRPDLSRQYGATGAIRNPILGWAWRASLPLREVAGPFLPRAVRDRLQRRILRDLDKPSIEPETRAELLRLFRDDTLRLQDLLGRDLSDWLR